MTQPPIGALLRGWRQRRRRSQLDLALDAEISQRHLSYVESGRAAPSRDMVLRLADQLEVPLRERNALLLAAGYAPSFVEQNLGEPSMAAARAAVEAILAAHMPHPALAVDRHWHMVAANGAVAPLLAGIEVTPPVNVLRLSLDPRGLASRIHNFAEWRHHILDRLRRQVEMSADAGLAALLAELSALPVPPPRAEVPPAVPGLGGLVVPMTLDTPMGPVALIATTTVFGAAMEVTLSELAIETFYPADPESAARLRALAP
ncbi:helix-turn-helix domain-containing protein [Roseococcus suduntuyensis]|uniref:Transcriptional regulator with XRE-family HTH domain n=1 Tax=Roseococcus suduntuyensis TaxID=455361 RepID=A0A840AFY4_9PROT|nr:helix-turn-helix transcriptional regulator [Roseococcus suduntuyensis]MBB3900011.1 transcriptional regulator with XRE-family HTH domain [Roseococcus suduntuyensis]